MELNKSFWTGLGCGICIGASLLTFKKLYKTKIVFQQLTSSTGYKLVFVVRTDLNMTKGKIAAQCSHAAVGAYKAAFETQPSILDLWQSAGQPKIALRTDSVEDLMKIKENAKKLGIITSLIRDDGRTQIPRGSITVLGVGPASSEVVNKVTRHLKLL